LRQAIYRVEVERRKPKNKRKFNTWIEHQVNKSYDDTKIAVAMLHKMYATLKNVEQINVDGGVMDEEARKELQAAYSAIRFD
jgi:hypothetical protein